MPTIDAEHHEIELRFLVLGGASDELLESLPLEDGCMVLGQLQGWRPRLVFRAFSVDPWAHGEAELLEAFVPYTDGLILTDALGEGQHFSSVALERLSRVLGPARLGLPTAIYGMHALEEEWTSLAGTKPVVVMEPRMENGLGVVKVLAGSLLRARMRSVPPPP